MAVSTKQANSNLNINTAAVSCRTQGPSPPEALVPNEELFKERATSAQVWPVRLPTRQSGPATDNQKHREPWDTICLHTVKTPN